MKIPKIGDYLKISGAEDKAALIVTGYEYDDKGNIINYNVAPEGDWYITFGKIIMKTPIVQ